MVGHRSIQTHCVTARRIDGQAFAIRSADTFTGTLDLMIGSDNTPTTPTDYDLKAPIGSLTDQTQAVDVDTTANEVRIVRQGRFVPSVDTTLGEIGLFADLHGFVDGAVGAQKTLLVRVTVDPPITLTTGTSYTIGLVIKL
jgi:hypothetical protein